MENEIKFGFYLLSEHNYLHKFHKSTLNYCYLVIDNNTVEVAGTEYFQAQKSCKRPTDYMHKEMKSTLKGMKCLKYLQ